ncbi:MULTISPECIES: amino acid ABC transporter permease [Rhizobium]|jgi:polar amino acid transport system permease protein|uniref:Amino acid ABC transporter membrane protein 2, PAAT family n=1 Tax=Rhizobium lusitanum TaxID=293958 RepID=A0A1C3WQR9_9HYPH|nr:MULTISPECIES: amino acid ABC transporter permease [Rhizobium]NRP87392.1 L-cystine transport system permease protein TcyB [Ensifer adhaerens]NKJ08099.1 polar amino acid transport system permease protein [Rhizobium sp. SG741]NKJ35052.1 polar amino acid transport system permease protein [Rhizobium sp. SG570]NTJ11282.1 amino acid ABC transporter permease [Rhizobium lusitanum]SCB42310.1 amino acid ABC transporter membrane protein 2, PAAT family [Rhizobium lusitanum]
MSHTFFEQIWIARYVIMNGVGVTVSISLLAILAGSLLGVFVGLALVYGGTVLRLTVRAYTDIIRGTPVLVLVLASYYVSSAVGLNLGPFSAGVLALAIFCSSHVGEIVRGALQAIPKGQTEAAKAIGLTFSQTFTSVLWPQAMRQCLPAWVNTAAEMVKASTLLSVIGVAELLLRTQEIISRNFMSLQFYFLAGALYFIVNFGIERFGKYVERKTALPS